MVTMLFVYSRMQVSRYEQRFNNFSISKSGEFFCILQLEYNQKLWLHRPGGVGSPNTTERNTSIFFCGQKQNQPLFQGRSLLFRKQERCGKSVSEDEKENS